MGIEGVGSKPSSVGNDEVYSDQKSRDALDAVLGPAVQNVAHKYSEPIAFFGNVKVTDDELRHGEVGRVLEDSKTSAMLSKMSETEVRHVVENEVRCAWPKLDETGTQKMVGRFMGQIDESARYHAIEGMRKEAVSTLREAAARTKDPEQKMLFEHEAKRLDRAGGDSVFRAMADHDVSAAFMKKAGISPQSLAGKQVEAAREQGHHDKESIEVMKMACTIAGAFATGGLGAVGAAGYAAGAASSVLMSGGAVLEKYQAIDSAKAGAAAGTMSEDAVRSAKVHAGIGTVALAVDAAIGPVAARLAHPIEHAIAPALQSVATEATIKGLAHGMSHAGLATGVIAAEVIATKVSH